MPSSESWWDVPVSEVAQLDSTRQARKTYEAVLKKDAAFLPARRNLAILCDLYLKDYDCALENYEKYRDANRGDQAVEIWIADVKARAGR